MSQYSDKTFETLQSEMLNDMGTDVDQQEGSLIATSIAKQAVRLEEFYQDLDYVNDQMLVDTMDREHLIMSGEECGMPITEGTYAEMQAVVNCEIPLDGIWSAMDSEYNYTAEEYLGTEDVTVTDDDGDQTTETWYKYRMEATEEGIEPGQYTGEIEPEDYIEGYEEARIESCITAGKDEEETEAYRARRLAYFDTKACAGNRAYYKQILSETGLVGGCKIPRRKDGDTSINITVQGANYDVMSSDNLKTLKEEVDPEAYTGEGYGLAPIGHKVTFSSVTTKTIDVSFTLTLTSGLAYADIKSKIETACSEYIESLKATWQNLDSIIVRRSGFENKILDVQGVVDIENLKLNNAETNISLGEYEIPELGTVTNS